MHFLFKVYEFTYKLYESFFNAVSINVLNIHNRELKSIKIYKMVPGDFIVDLQNVELIDSYIFAMTIIEYSFHNNRMELELRKIRNSHIRNIKTKYK